MRIVVALVALLYVLAAFYGYFWWSGHHNIAVQPQVAEIAATAPATLAAPQLQFPDVKLADDSDLLFQQLRSLQGSFESQLKQLELKQDAALKILQNQIDVLKQQKIQSLASTKTIAPNSTEDMASHSIVPILTEQVLEEQAQSARKTLKAGVSQLDVKLQTEIPDLGRQSIFQQKLEDAFNQAELASLIQGRTECGQAFCKLDIQGEAPEGVDVLQALWEQHVFPESTEVLTIPKSDGSGWIIYVAQDGQSLPNLP